MSDMIGEYEAWLRRQRRADYTVAQYVTLLRRMDRELPCGIATCTLDELTGWIYNTERSETTYSHYSTVARGFGRWATDPKDPRLEFHASEDLPDVEADSTSARPATEAEFATIRERAAEPWLDLYELAGWAGMRCVEIHRARREHVSEREIRMQGKGGKWRTVPTHPELWARFRDRGPGPLARDRDGTPLTRAQTVARGDYYLRMLGLEISMHQLRKRFATQVYRTSGHDIRLVQHLLGHARVDTTQRYLGVDAEAAVDVVTRLTVAA